MVNDTKVVKMHLKMAFNGILRKINIKIMKISRQIDAIMYSRFKSIKPRTKESKINKNFKVLCVF